MVNCYLQTSNETILYDLHGSEGSVTFKISDQLATDNFNKIKSESWKQLGFCGVRITVPENHRVVLHMHRAPKDLEIAQKVNVDNDRIQFYAPMFHKNSYYLADRHFVVVFMRMDGIWSGSDNGFKGVGFYITINFYARNGFEVVPKNRNFCTCTQEKKKNLQIPRLIRYLTYQSSPSQIFQLCFHFSLCICTCIVFMYVCMIVYMYCVLYICVSLCVIA